MTDAANNSAAAKIRLFSKQGCRHCVSAQALLDRLGLVYEYVDLTGDVDAQVALAKRTGQMTLPQIEIGGKHLGGYNDLEAAVREDRLAGLLVAS
ncbi:MAG: glutaredoxin [Thermoleophilaceae bacterium]|nr:glutaredoxin [Thermoleophilaceae bacterium]